MIETIIAVFVGYPSDASLCQAEKADRGQELMRAGPS